MMIKNDDQWCEQKIQTSCHWVSHFKNLIADPPVPSLWLELKHMSELEDTGAINLQESANSKGSIES